MSNRRRPRTQRVFHGLEIVDYGVGYLEQTDFDGEGAAVMVRERPDGQRRAAVLPRSMTRLRGESLEAASELQHMGIELMELAEAIDAQVAACREEGVPWSVIGWCMGTTGEAARQKWGPAIEAAN